MVPAVPSFALPFIVMMAWPILASDKGLDLEIVNMLYLGEMFPINVQS
jgi:hypothetical protein